MSELEVLIIKEVFFFLKDQRQKHISNIQPYDTLSNILYDVISYIFVHHNEVITFTTASNVPLHL